ncbi:MAG: hypothetical protein H7Z42_11375 [Roseiflexaceae bacterium]|nr:hypothetical protein [Roseiflexaceae bacterium]
MSDDQKKHGQAQTPPVPAQNDQQPKPESSSEYEGAQDRKPTGNKATEAKTETSSSSGQ